MARWVRAASVSDVPAGNSFGASVEGKDIGLFNVDGEVYAMDNLCPHRGAPLSDGRLDGATIVCPWHGWAFDVQKGALVMDPNRCQARYPVEKRGADLFVDVEANG